MSLRAARDPDTLPVLRWRRSDGRPPLILLDIMMSLFEHHDVRTTLTLDDDVAAKLTAEARRSGRSFRETVNDFLRRGLAKRKDGNPREAFQVVARDLGDLRPGLQLDNISDLLEQVEGSLHR